MELSEFEKTLLNSLQKGLSICSKPYEVLAKILNTDEETILKTIRDLQTRGYIRKIGFFFDSQELGYKGTLVALAVETAELEKVAEVINKYHSVTHNYEREGKYNLWFTIITSNPETETKILSEVKRLKGVSDILNLKSNKKYKINVHFNLE